MDIFSINIMELYARFLTRVCDLTLRVDPVWALLTK